VVRKEICEIIKALLLCREDLAEGNECLQSALAWLEETTDMGIVMPSECQCTLQVIAAFAEWKNRDFNLTVLQGEDYNSLVVVTSTWGLADYRRVSAAESQQLLGAALGGLVGSHFFLLKKATSAAIKCYGLSLCDRLTDAFMAGMWKRELAIRGSDIEAVMDPVSVYNSILERSTEASFSSQWVVISNFPLDRMDPTLLYGDILTICKTCGLVADQVWLKDNCGQESFLINIVLQPTRTFMVKLAQPTQVGITTEFVLRCIILTSLLKPEMGRRGRNSSQ
jgi:hypothetical protein